jgi:hypothetical protein
MSWLDIFKPEKWGEFAKKVNDAVVEYVKLTDLLLKYKWYIGPLVALGGAYGAALYLAERVQERPVEQYYASIFAKSDAHNAWILLTPHCQDTWVNKAKEFPGMTGEGIFADDYHTTASHRVIEVTSEDRSYNLFSILTRTAVTFDVIYTATDLFKKEDLDSRTEADNVRWLAALYHGTLDAFRSGPDKEFELEMTRKFEVIVDVNLFTNELHQTEWKICHFKRRAVTVSMF